MADEQLDFEEPTVLLRDEVGRTLPCSVEQTFELSQQKYLLLLPIDTPIEIFVLQEEDDEEVLMDVVEDEIDVLFPTARAVLSEQNLMLQRTAITLTAAGEIPEATDDACLTLELDESISPEPDATEEFQVLARFYHEEQEFTLCTPLNPLLIFARKTSQGRLEVVSPEEFQEIRSTLEEKLFDMLD